MNTKWICTACDEAENTTNSPCHLVTPTDDEPTICPLSGDECEWRKEKS